MKNVFLFLLLGIFFINFVNSLDCQYKVNETYQELELGLYDSNGNFVGPPLDFKDFVGGSFNLYGCNPPSFKVHNTLGKDIILNISYTTEWNTAFGSRSQNHQGTITISQYLDSDFLMGSCPDIGSGSISKESVKYLILEPEIITLENEQVTKQREICKICPNGKQCLDDGSSCDLNIACGSNICNIAGFCGYNKTVPCEPYGKLNCKDQACLMPSTKEVGEAYMCDWECKSDRFENEKCLISKEELIRRWVYWITGVVTALILTTLIIKYLIKKRILDPRIKELEDKIIALARKFEQKGKDIKELEEKGASLKEIIKKSEELIDIGNNKINSFNELIRLKESELKEVKGNVRKKIENELKILKNKLEEITKANILLKQSNDRIEKEQKRKEGLAIKKYGGENKVFIDENGYLRFYSLKDGSKTGERYHRWLYFSKFPETPRNYEIHHIDGEKLNNEMWNLIALEKSIHKYYVSEGKIKGEKWEVGLKHLIDLKIVKEENFHKYIQQEIQKRKKQRKL